MNERDRYKKRRTNRKTFSFHIDPESVESVETLIQMGVFQNKSHAVDEALVLLLSTYRHLVQSEQPDLKAPTHV